MTDHAETVRALRAKIERLEKALRNAHETANIELDRSIAVHAINKRLRREQAMSKPNEMTVIADRQALLEKVATAAQLYVHQTPQSFAMAWTRLFEAVRDLDELEEGRAVPQTRG